MKLQKEKIIEVIEKDAVVRQQYQDISGQCCVIGGLLNAAGFDMKRLRQVNRMCIGSRELQLAEARACLREAYGLSREVAGQLQELNDCFDSIDKRRKALIAAVRQAPETEVW